MKIHRNQWKELYAQIGKKIRIAREVKGLTQTELASLISLSRTSITNIENGRQRIKVHLLYEIATALRQNIHDLLPDVNLAHTKMPADSFPDNLDASELRWIESIISESNTEETNGK